MNMRKQKNAGRLLSRLLCLVTAMGMLVPMALADELGKVPGSSDTKRFRLSAPVRLSLYAKSLRDSCSLFNKV